MKKLFAFAIISSACLCAFAQGVTAGSDATALGTAVNDGVKTNVQLNIEAAKTPDTQRIKYDNNVAPALGTIVGTQPVQGTCDSGGYGLGGSVKGGGALIQLPGETEEGCDTVRDVNITVFVETIKDAGLRHALRMRICGKDTIHKMYVEADMADLCKPTTGQRQAQFRASEIAAGRPDPGVGFVYSQDSYIAKRQRATQREQAAALGAGQQPIALPAAYATTAP